MGKDMIWVLGLGGLVIGGFVWLVRKDNQQLDAMSSKDRAEVMKARAYSAGAASIAHSVFNGTEETKSKKKKKKGKK